MWSIFLLALGSAGTAVAVWLVMRDLPLADILPAVAEPSVSVETVDGKVLTTQGGYQAPYVGFDEFPPHLVDAVLAVEDRRFFEHSGVDVRGISRAFYRNFTAGGVVEGGSTITQQLVKILYLEPERTISRKLQEAVLATTLERQLGKERIIELYLNSVYLGSGAYGMPAAAETYYGKDVSDLSLPRPRRWRRRSSCPPGSIRSPTWRSAEPRGVGAEPHGGPGPHRRGHAGSGAGAARAARARAAGVACGQLLRRLGAGGGRGAGGRKLPEPQRHRDPRPRAPGRGERIVQRVMAEEGAAAGASQAAVVVMTPSGRVRVMVGGLDYGTSEFNRATAALRQPGSTFKTFVYLAALVMGATPDSTVSDAPIQIGDWSPQNFDGESHGTVTLRQAFAESYNQAAVRLAQAVGNDNIIEVAQRLGIEAELQDTPSLALGPSEEALLDMTEAFRGPRARADAGQRHRHRDAELRRRRRGAGRHRESTTASRPGSPARASRCWTSCGPS
jgi:membrane peptidoglycan carboxypeptidase